MKKILCYGDSNTFGFIPQTGKRYNVTQRWSGILKNNLSDNFVVIEEGMNNRTGFFKNSQGIKFSGTEYLPLYLENHTDIDICILALGTNDSQIFYNLDENITQTGLENLIKILRDKNNTMQIMIIPPVKITKNILHSGFSIMFDQTSIEKIQSVFPTFKQIATKENCHYFDFNEIVSPSETDGLHYTQESHEIIAKSLESYIRKNF